MEMCQNFRTTCNPFPDGPETLQCNFKGYAQKLSSRFLGLWAAVGVEWSIDLHELLVYNIQDSAITSKTFSLSCLA